jgi:hypothetical protein
LPVILGSNRRAELGIGPFDGEVRVEHGKTKSARRDP